MHQPIRFLMAQINPTVGAIEANAARIIEIISTHQETHDVIIFPELALTGYPPEDLLFRGELFDRVEQALTFIQSATLNCHVVIGHPERCDLSCFNTASIFHNQQSLARYHKQYLPNDGVFDERRYFEPGPPTPYLFTLNNQQIGVCICEDIWHAPLVDQFIHAGATTLICINASPFDVQKPSKREALLKPYAQRGLFILYVNLVGGQDELVFDGQSLAIDPTGTIYARSTAFKEHLHTVAWPLPKIAPHIITPPLDTTALIYQALCCGLRDYVRKNKFPGIILGLSGGIDSALTLAIAVDALGASQVLAVMMPSRFTSIMSTDDALEQLQTMNVPHTTCSIEPAFHSFLTTLTPECEPMKPLVQENLQARIRGTLLMALSNQTGQLVLTTSNKSETAVGYSTLYGDMCGGFSVLKDVLKTTVYQLAHYRNQESPVIPLRVINRPPSAELAYDQTDQDTLPDYETLDAIITQYMEEKRDADAIIEAGYPADRVHQIIGWIKRNEYKRKQAAPGVKVSPCAFDKDWRYPLTSAF